MILPDTSLVGQCRAEQAVAVFEFKHQAIASQHWPALMQASRILGYDGAAPSGELHQVLLGVVGHHLGVGQARIR